MEKKRESERTAADVEERGEKYGNTTIRREEGEGGEVSRGGYDGVGEKRGGWGGLVEWSGGGWGCD